MVVPDIETSEPNEDEGTVWVWTVANLIASGIPKELLDRAIREGILVTEDFEGEPAIREEDFEQWKRFGMSGLPAHPLPALELAESPGAAREPTPGDQFMWNKDPYLRWVWYNEPDLYPFVGLNYTFAWTARKLARTRKISEQEARDILNKTRRRYNDDRAAGLISPVQPTIPQPTTFLDGREASEEKRRLRRIIESWKD